MSFRPDVYKSKTAYKPEGVSDRRLYDDRRWREYAERFKQQHPLCALCGAVAYGHVEIETRTGRERNESLGDVDHIIPHNGDVKLFWDVNNHQTLCKRCHGRKSKGER